MVVSSILSLWVAFQRLTRVEAALVPLARTHIVIVSARAVAATAVEAMSEAASAARSVLVVMAFLPIDRAYFSAILAKELPSTAALRRWSRALWEKLFPRNLYRGPRHAARRR